MKGIVRHVESRGDLNTFIRFPMGLYHGRDHYVPPLIRERKRFFDPRRNPSFAHLDAVYFLAQGGGGDVQGVVSAHINHRHNQCWNEKTGCFGFFECVGDQGVARSLLAAAEGWLRDRGMARIRGPLNFSTNDECGLLVEGFDQDPALMMPYTLPYYPELVETAGYRPVKDLLAYHLAPDRSIPPHLERAGQRLAQRVGVTIRPVLMRRFASEVACVFRIYNRAWEDNWGFVPMTEDEFRHLAAFLKPVIDPQLALIAEVDGQPVGCILPVPDVNPLLKPLRGRMGPIGLLQFQLARRRVHALRVVVLGVLPTFRKRGIESLLIEQVYRRGFARGYDQAEMSWILDDNVLMDRAIRRLGGVVSKRYRLYEKGL